MYVHGFFYIFVVYVHEIHFILPDKRKIRIKDIAEKAGVSIGTVDRVLHERGEVKQETRTKVLSIIDEMGYTPNLLAKSLASKKTYRFAVIIPNASDNNPYWKKPLEGIELGAREIKDYNTRVDIFSFNATDITSFQAACQKALELNPSGIVFNPVFREASNEYSLKLGSLGIPYVYVDTELEEGNNLAYFGQDAVKSGRVAAKLFSKILPPNSTILILKLANKGVISHHLQKREKGFIDFFRQKPNCECRFISKEIDLLEKGNPGKVMDSLLTENPDIKGIFVPNSRVFTVAGWLSANISQKILLLGYDLVEENIRYIKSGVIDFLIAQKPENQGYDSLLALFNHVVLKKEIQKTNYSAIDIIVDENIDFFIN